MVPLAKTCASLADDMELTPLWVEFAVRSEALLEKQQLESAVQELERASVKWHAAPGGMHASTSDSPDWQNGEFDYTRTNAPALAPATIRTSLQNLASDLGLAFERREKYDEALKLFNMSIYLSGEDKNSPAYERLVDCYVAMKEYQAAEQLQEDRVSSIERSIQRIKQNQELGILNLDAGPELAQDLAKQQRKLADIYRKHNRPEQSKEWLRQAEIASAIKFSNPGNIYRREKKTVTHQNSQIQVVSQLVIGVLAGCAVAFAVFLLFRNRQNGK